MDNVECDDNQFLEKMFLLPGQIIVSKKPILITTVLGSCIAVCLWDERLKFGGMNHFMVPSWTGEKKPTPKYGDLAINKLVEKMLGMGSQKRDLRAKVFGGAENLNETITYFETGVKNTLLAKSLLDFHNISVIAENTGGSKGRNIKFYTECGRVLMKIIPKSKLNVEA
jgi:chemotaxis protein CheD